MARSISIIKQQIIDSKNAESALSGLNSTSQTAIWNLWAFITAVAINLHEQLWDIFRSEVDEIAAKTIPGTPIWLRSKVLEFQYGPSEILQLVNLAPTYAIIKPDLRLVTQCSVKQESNRVVFVKTAKEVDGALQPLGYPLDEEEDYTLDDNPEINALRNYIDRIKFAGTSVRVISIFPDRLQVFANIYYDGQYVSTNVKAEVIKAITNYLKNLPFDGVVSSTKLVDAIQVVPGVAEIRINQIKARDYQTPAFSNMGLTLVDPVYTTIAGYIIPEDHEIPNEDLEEGEDPLRYQLSKTINMIPAHELNL